MWIPKSSELRKLHSNCTSAISGVYYYFMRLPRSLRLFAMTTRYLCKNDTSNIRIVLD
ncbi:hypothetical protein [Rickettsia hoogstraalii]|uniref:hypothetical protein n=1 Tax=Rickettsia hoogstraalii TaxID=467174 RepID=UPI0018CDAFB1|nr:hypothetical protein [Rickettsia hoogstraalii]